MKIVVNVDATKDDCRMVFVPLSELAALLNIKAGDQEISVKMSMDQAAHVWRKFGVHLVAGMRGALDEVAATRT